MFLRNVGKFNLYAMNKSKMRPSPDAHKIWIRYHLLSFQSNNRDIHTKAFWIYSAYFTVSVLSHGILRWTCSSTRHGNLHYARSSEASPRHPGPNPLLRQIFGFYRPQYFNHPHPEFVTDWPAPRKILSCKFLSLKLYTLMKKSDSTSRITSWIQKLHSSRTLVIITFGTNLTERRAEEKEEYGHIPCGVKTQITVRLGLHLEARALPTYGTSKCTWNTDR
jgi:hypothetical protein